MMKKAVSLILALAVCLSLCACGGSAGTEQGGGAAAPISRNVEMYAPMVTMKTDFGEVTVLDAAFCGKAQLFYTVSTYRHKSTVNGKTTESSSETIHPGYFSARDGKILFALRTMMTNTSGADIDLFNLQVTAQFQKDEPVYFSKGGNVQVSDPAYKTLAAGDSAEIILAAWVPVEQYMAADSCLLEIGGAKLGFDYDSIAVYSSMGYQEGDNTPTTIDAVLQMMESGAVPTTEAPTEPPETEPEIETTPGVYARDGESRVAEGRAVTISNVSVGFVDQLPRSVQEHARDHRWELDKLELNDSMVYSVIQFTIKNQTTDLVDLADIHDDFMVQLIYNNGYRYSTGSDLYAVFVCGANQKLQQDRSSTGFEISVAPLATQDVTVYIPCAAEAAENTQNPLSVKFISKYAGNESFDFIIR